MPRKRKEEGVVSNIGLDDPSNEELLELERKSVKNPLNYEPLDPRIARKLE